MSASLVGSEMCIRDRPWPRCPRLLRSSVPDFRVATDSYVVSACQQSTSCLLYTSDAADDM
eukprot:8353323-Alexandrium_andersonii.AAC.1